MHDYTIRYDIKECGFKVVKISNCNMDNFLYLLAEPLNHDCKSKILELNGEIYEVISESTGNVIIEYRFETKEIAEKMFDWLESRLTMNKLINI